MIPSDPKNHTASAATLKLIKLSALTIAVLMLAGIAALMILAAGKGEDITGIVAPALLVTFVSGVVATVAAVLQLILRGGVRRWPFTPTRPAPRKGRD